jgi:putative endonuclease
MYFVYILQSLKDGRFYVGQTDRIIARFRQHQAGEVRSTKAYGPWWMPYYEIHETRTDAIRRERQIKKRKSSKSIRRIIAAGSAL